MDSFLKQTKPPVLKQNKVSRISITSSLFVKQKYVHIQMNQNQIAEKLNLGGFTFLLTE